ncbi:hypothetical protein CONLIGDRAFT_409930 [Coniochaeta ligniaria NRRL 30616]|uniref:Uncharacterized protein n=1 Tax=Coniochaeta ligniaria NRRL 30616 TaxID=1408157 RepID=A0A1J7INM3_9PEZI|nr:hypothetical protein CONLIGDRAFT_409930 [Coniochaeta ligniaria NRRL 30616]
MLAVTAAMFSLQKICYWLVDILGRLVASSPTYDTKQSAILSTLPGSKISSSSPLFLLITIRTRIDLMGNLMGKRAYSPHAVHEPEFTPAYARRKKRRDIGASMHPLKSDGDYAVDTSPRVRRESCDAFLLSSSGDLGAGRREGITGCDYRMTFVADMAVLINIISCCAAALPVPHP